MLNRKLILQILPYAICLLFFIAYSTLSIIRHNHYQSFGYDLGINDQVVWHYSKLQAPISTIGPYPDKTKLYEHVELIFAFVSPFYWIWSSRRMLLMVEAAALCLGGVAIFLLARQKKLSYPVSIAILIGYLAFFGIQNAAWFDTHSESYGAAFLAWFLYVLENKKTRLTILFFLLAITSKENIAFITFAISLFYFIKRRNRLNASIMLVSVFYLFFIFFIYFPQILHTTYLYQNKEGLLSNLNPLYLFNTQEKLQAIFYTFASFGFIPILLPLALLPALAHFVTFFVIASDLPGAQGIYMHYRVTLAPLLAWGTILTISKYKFLNSKYVAIYLLLSTMFVQYTLHLPLSYLTKNWFWYESPEIANINALIKNRDLPRDASVVAQNNIVPHISQRDKIYSLYPEQEHFSKNSPCGKPDCNWFRWYDHPEYLFVDISSEWDSRHLLANNAEFVDGIKNLERAHVITKYKQVGNAILYKVNKNPDEVE